MSTPNQPPGEPPWGWQQPQGGPPPGWQQPPGYPPQQPYPGGYPGYAGYPGYPDAQAPFGRDAVTGLPLSDKSATTAGLLQLFLGVFGIGRFYLDSTQIAVAQLCVGLFGLIFGVFCFFGLPVLLGSIVWAVIDAILIFTGSVSDHYGRRLR